MSLISRLAPLAGLLLASACCTQLPKLPRKRITTLPSVRAVNAVEESTADWRDERRSRDIPVHIYAPSTPGAHPVVVFSHGIGEDRDSYAYLGRALAGAGFLTVHLTHAGTDKAMLRRGYLHLYRSMKRAQTWIDRAADVSFVLDRIAGRPDADMSRVAVVGHSAGAFTAFALAGVYAPGGASLADERVRVIVPMSMPRIDALRYDRVSIPALNMTGTCDASLLYRTLPRRRRVPFERAAGPNQYLATIDRVNHDTFSNRTDRHHAAIAVLTIAFLRAWLENDASAKAWFDDSGTGEVDGDEVALERK